MRHFENTLSADVDKDLMEIFDSGANEISALEKREFGQSMRKIMLLADNANQYLDQENLIMIKNERKMRFKRSVPMLSICS